MKNILNCTKQEILDRAKYRCVHRHNGISHTKCFDNKNGKVEERIAFLDIETENLNADWGIMFCWVIKDSKTGKILFDTLQKRDLSTLKPSNIHDQPKDDKRLVAGLIDALRGFDRVVAHFGVGFDFPFMRTRAVICGLEFPSYGELFQSDTWVYLKKKFKLSRNSLENGCRALCGETHKDRLSLSARHGCLRGEKWAMDYTLKHCIQDVEDLFALYNKTNRFSRKTKSSI